MNADRKVLSSILATVAAAALVGVATLGGTFAASGDAATTKADRFTMASDSLCAGQTWPNLTDECIAFREGEGGNGVRFVTMVRHDADMSTSTLSRVREIPTN